MSADNRFGVLFVCLGNICRSPAAEAVFCRRLADTGLGSALRADSAGTGSWMIGSPPDLRMVAAAARRGYRLDGLRARRVNENDFFDFDAIYAMDRHNLAELNRLRPSGAGPRPALLLDHAVRKHGLQDIPDPYSGGESGFEQVLDLIEDAIDGLLQSLRLELAKASDES